MRQFRLRGLAKVNGEGRFIAAGQNLKRLLSAQGWVRRPWPGGAAGFAHLTPDFALRWAGNDPSMVSRASIGDPRRHILLLASPAPDFFTRQTNIYRDTSRRTALPFFLIGEEGRMVVERICAESDIIGRWSESLDALHQRIACRFARTEVRGRAKRYLVGLLDPIKQAPQVAPESIAHFRPGEAMRDALTEIGEDAGPLLAAIGRTDVAACHTRTPFSAKQRRVAQRSRK